MFVVMGLCIDYQDETPSIYGYSEFMNELLGFKFRRFKQLSINDYKKRFYSVFREAYTKHPYTERCEALIESLSTIRVGG